MIVRLTRLLGLLVVVLCTLVPADVRARMAEACRDSDDCACRKGEHADAAPQPVARRIDCCAAPCEIDVTRAAADVSPSRELVIAASVTVLPDPIIAAPSAAASVVAHRGGRDPPQRIHALVQHWLV